MDDAGNTPLSYAILSKHSSATMMLLQEGAKLNSEINPRHHLGNNISKPNTISPFCFTKYQFEQANFREQENLQPFSVFKGIVQNAWLGITYIALNKMENFGFSYARYIKICLNSFRFFAPF